MTIIYEVNIEVDESITESFESWIKPHMNEVSSFDGFIDATLLKEINISEQRWSVQYLVASMDYLQQYFDLHAPLMRQQAIDKFGDSLKIHRRILMLGG
jgi:Domain of unknown function (DUF4286)